MLLSQVLVQAHIFNLSIVIVSFYLELNFEVDFIYQGTPKWCLKNLRSRRILAKISDATIADLLKSRLIPRPFKPTSRSRNTVPNPRIAMYNVSW